jgi:CRP/FNR family transcriptional regulator
MDLAGGDAERGTRVTLPMRKGELALLLGTRQETLSRAFRRLADARMIRVDGGNVVLLDPDRLEDVALGEFPGV